MRKSRFTKARIVAILAEQERGSPTAEVCRRHGIGSTTLYEWKSKHSGMDVSDIRRLKGLEDENARLRKLLAHQMLDDAVLKDLLGRSRRRLLRGGRRPSGRCGTTRCRSAGPAARSAQVPRPCGASGRPTAPRHAFGCAKSPPSVGALAIGASG